MDFSDYDAFFTKIDQCMEKLNGECLRLTEEMKNLVILLSLRSKGVESEVSNYFSHIMAVVKLRGAADELRSSQAPPPSDAHSFEVLKVQIQSNLKKAEGHLKRARLDVRKEAWIRIKADLEFVHIHPFLRWLFIHNKAVRDSLVKDYSEKLDEITKRVQKARNEEISNIGSDIDQTIKNWDAALDSMKTYLKSGSSNSARAKGIQNMGHAVSWIEGNSDAIINVIAAAISFVVAYLITDVFMIGMF